MSSPLEPLGLFSIGRFAHAALEPYGEGRAIAVFERSCYCETPAGLACVGSVGNGPLNAVPDRFPAGLAVGDTLRFELGNASVWKPRAPPAWNARVVSKSLARLRLATTDRLPGEGLGFLLCPTVETPPAVVALAHWLADPVGEPTGAEGLVGLGPGLTPAGDDLLGGALCALHAAGRIELADRLAAWALRLAEAGTSRISRAHLVCAAQGECGEAVHNAIVALLSGDPVDLARVDEIGHTSGWDALAGAALALEALAV